MTITYTAKSLEDIVGLFMKNADAARAASDRALTQKSMASFTASSYTWTQAAEILRATTMISDEKKKKE